MRRRITRFEPWQTTKMMIGLYALIGLIAGILFSLVPAMMPFGGYRIGFAAIIVMPICYAIAGLIFIPIFCVLYNFIAGYLGGIEINTEDAPPG